MLKIADYAILCSCAYNRIYTYKGIKMRKLVIAVVPLILLFGSCSKEQKVDQVKTDEGLTQLQKGEFQEAIKTFAAIDSVNPGSPQGIYGKAIALEREGLILEAMHSLTQMMQKHSRSAEGYRLLSELQSRDRRHDQAIFNAGKYASLVGENESSAALMAQALLAGGQIAKAGEIIEERLKATASQPDFLLTAARYYLLTGKIERARELKAQGEKALSDNPVDFLRAGSLQALMGQTDSAGYFFQMAATRPKADFYFKADAADSLISIKYFHKAQEILSQLEKANSKSHRIFALRTNIMRRMGKDFNAHLIYGDAVSANPNSPTILSNFGRSMLTIYHTTGAEAHMTNALSMAENGNYSSEDQAFIMLTHLEALWGRKEVGPSMAALQPLLESMPTEFRALNLAADFTWRYAPPEESRHIVSTFERLSDGNPYRLTRVGDFYAGIDSLKTAKEYYDEALKLAPNFHPAIKGLIGLLKKVNQPERFIEYLSTLPEFISIYPDFAEERITTLRQLKRYPEAMEFSEKFIKAGPGDLERYRIGIAIAEQAGDRARAEAWVNDCLQKNGADPESFVIAADFKLRQGVMTEADASIQKALALDSGCVNAFLVMAKQDTLAGNDREAMKLYEKVIQIDQFSAEAYNNLAWLLLKTGGDPRVATNHAAAAISYDPLNGQNYVTLGWSHYKQNRFDLARGDFERGLQIAPENPVLNFYAGLNYIKDNKPDKAREHLRKSLNGELPEALRKEAEENLKKL